MVKLLGWRKASTYVHVLFPKPHLPDEKQVRQWHRDNRDFMERLIELGFPRPEEFISRCCQDPKVREDIDRLGVMRGEDRFTAQGLREPGAALSPVGAVSAAPAWVPNTVGYQHCVLRPQVQVDSTSQIMEAIRLGMNLVALALVWRLGLQMGKTIASVARPAAR